MADESDVEATLAATVAAILYPTPSASVTGDAIRVARGWPTAAALDTALAAGSVTVTIYPENAVRRTTRYLGRQVTELPATPPSLTVSMSPIAPVVTFGGTASPGQIAAVQVGHTGYTHRCAAGDTPSTVAAALAVLTGGTAAGTVLTTPTAPLAAIYADAATLTENRRQQQRFRVIVWAPLPLQRDAVSGAIDAALSGVDWLALPDGSAGRLLYEQTVSLDTSETAKLYRRDLIYSVEFPTTLAALLPRVAFPALNVNAQPFGVLEPAAVAALT